MLFITKSQCRHVGPQEQPEPGIRPWKVQIFQNEFLTILTFHKAQAFLEISQGFPSNNHLAKTPHEGTVDSHQLLSVHPVRLVQDDPDLVVEPLKKY